MVIASVLQDVLYAVLSWLIGGHCEAFGHLRHHSKGRPLTSCTPGIDLACHESGWPARHRPEDVAVAEET